MEKYIKIIFISFLIVQSLNAQIFVSPDGNDTNIGSIDMPIQTIQKAFDMIKVSGDTIYLREGIYQDSVSLQTPISGDSLQFKCLFAYPGEHPVIDFSGQVYSSSSRGIKLSENYWHIKGIEIENAGDNGMHISGNYNIVENCSLHHNKDTGLQISNGGSYNKIINCDSYLNYDPDTHGENADGFAPKLDVGPGNYFNNCRAYFNADDGWDCYESQYQIIIDSCWSFHNGYNVWGDVSYQGDGNGFKLGGNYVSAHMIIRNSIAFDNKAKGFDQNHNTGGITVLNCTAYRNQTDFSFSENPNDSVHIIKNNISLNGEVKIASSSIDEKNSWNGFSISSSDFQSLDTSLASLPRDENFHLQKNEFLRLASTSSMIDAGEVVGIKYLGAAPDLGAFESNAVTSVENEKIVNSDFQLMQNYPNPFNPSTKIQFRISSKSFNNSQLVKLTVYDILGNKISALVNEKKSPGDYEIQFDGSNLSSGVYYYQLKSGSYIQSKKMILLK